MIHEIKMPITIDLENDFCKVCNEDLCLDTDNNVTKRVALLNNSVVK